jgi:hypothetical protein
MPFVLSTLSHQNVKGPSAAAAKSKDSEVAVEGDDP